MLLDENIQKQVLKVQKLHNRINNIRTDYINKTINELVKTRAKFINIEDLNISGMMKNRHLSKAIAEQKLYEFRNKLINKCHQNRIKSDYQIDFMQVVKLVVNVVL